MHKTKNDNTGLKSYRLDKLFKSANPFKPGEVRYFRSLKILNASFAEKITLKTSAFILIIK